MLKGVTGLNRDMNLVYLGWKDGMRMMMIGMIVAGGVVGIVVAVAVGIEGGKMKNQIEMKTI